MPLYKVYRPPPFRLPLPQLHFLGVPLFKESACFFCCMQPLLCPLVLMIKTVTIKTASKLEKVYERAQTKNNKNRVTTFKLVQDNGKSREIFHFLSLP